MLPTLFIEINECGFYILVESRGGFAPPYDLRVKINRYSTTREYYFSSAEIKSMTPAEKEKGRQEMLSFAQSLFQRVDYGFPILSVEQIKGLLEGVFAYIGV